MCNQYECCVNVTREYLKGITKDNLVQPDFKLLEKLLVLKWKSLVNLELSIDTEKRC